MSLKTRHLLLIIFMMITISGVISGEDIPDVYGEERPNLLIGGIGESSGSKPDDNSDYKRIADQIDATYVPVYYTGSRVDDVFEVNKAASSNPTYQNGLKRDELRGVDESNKKGYDTIVAYSGGTATAVEALAHQYVKCRTLILISPMAAETRKNSYLTTGLTLLTTNKDDFYNEIENILKNGAVENIVVIQSENDKLTSGDLYQYRFHESTDKITVHNVVLETTGETAHKELFFDYAKDHLGLDDNGRIYYEPKGGVNSELDSDPPIVQAFKVTPLSVSTGESFTIDYTASDNDESGLKQVELWRKDEQRDWQEIKSNAASSEDQPISGSFTDYPSTPGKYWYGLHVVDKAGNWNDERNSNSNNPTSRFEPNEVEVKEDALLTLYVRDGNARGPIIPDAQVTGQDGAGKTFERTTDSNGYVTIKGAPGTWSFSTSANGYETNNWDQEITEACTKHAFLERYKPNQLSGAKPSDYFSILNENLWDTKWAAKGSGDKGRPAYQSRSSTSPYASQNAQPYIQPVPVAPTTTRGYGSSVIGKWLIIRHSDWGDGYKYTTFRNDGTLTSSEWYECHGTFPYLDEYMEDEWTQDGNVIRWSDSIQENFEGTLNEDTIRGVVSSPNDRNTFSAERVGTG